ncbi:MAG: hypothetical protein ABIO79_10350 [Ferruginibacter sp.]
MKIVFILLWLPLFSICQNTPNTKLPFKTTIISDSGSIKGYLVSYSDSEVIISVTKTYLPNSTITIPASAISKLDVKHKTGTTLLGATLAAVLGFTITAGLTKNMGDVDNDGKTSFWELLYTAIEGTTSSNRKRRNTALIVGGAGATTAVIIGLVANKKVSLTFPLNGRSKFFSDNKHKISELVNF